MEKTKKIKIKEILSQHLSKNEKAKLYFVKGLKNHSNSIVIKAKKNFGKTQLNELNQLLGIPNDAESPRRIRGMSIPFLTNFANDIPEIPEIPEKPKKQKNLKKPENLN